MIYYIIFYLTLVFYFCIILSSINNTGDIMATQGLVTITNKNNKVLFKIVTGSDGYNINRLSELIASEKIAHNELTAECLYQMALDVAFGTVDSLVIIDHNSHYVSDEPLEKDSLYFTKFDIPDFNPRWECGLTEYFAQIVLKDQI